MSCRFFRKEDVLLGKKSGRIALSRVVIAGVMGGGGALIDCYVSFR